VVAVRDVARQVEEIPPAVDDADTHAPPDSVLSRALARYSLTARGLQPFRCGRGAGQLAVEQERRRAGKEVKPVTPADAAKMVDKKATVEMEVKSVGKGNGVSPSSKSDGWPLDATGRQRGHEIMASVQLVMITEPRIRQSVRSPTPRVGVR
jgi:hypothetical protein